MIYNDKELEISTKQLKTFCDILKAMEKSLTEHGRVNLFPTIAEAYLDRIKYLEKEILEYVNKRSK